MIASAVRQEEIMDGYSTALEGQMLRFYRSLTESDRRRYAALEAIRLGHGGIEYVSRILGCDPKTISKGIAEIESDDELASDRQRKKGVAAKQQLRNALRSNITFKPS
jgi:hypothetical protein